VPVFDSAALRLSQTLTTLTTSHAQNAQAIASSAEQQVLYDKEEASLRRQVSEAEEKRAWFQTFKEQIETVAEFLDEKVGSSMYNLTLPVLTRFPKVSNLREVGGRAHFLTQRKDGDDKQEKGG
jgi:hypothetical protein